MLVVGLTGDVGAGKSTLSSIWAAAGAHLIDADAIVADIWKREEMISLSVKRWGKDILSSDGHPDHAAISGIVFDNDKEYRWVCEILHPQVRAAMAEMVTRLDGWVVAEIPLLFENGVSDWIDLTVYVEAPADMRFFRNKFRGWSQDEITRRERRLMESSQKRKLADFIVTNNGTLENLERKAKDLARRFKAASSIMRISVTACTLEKIHMATVGLKDSSLAFDISMAASGFSVSAFIREESIGKILPFLENIKLAEGISIRTEKVAKTPRHVLFWAMGSIGH